jgi:hypothetical protein
MPAMRYSSVVASSVVTEPERLPVTFRSATVEDVEVIVALVE